MIQPQEIIIYARDLNFSLVEIGNSLGLKETLPDKLYINYRVNAEGHRSLEFVYTTDSIKRIRRACNPHYKETPEEFAQYLIDTPIKCAISDIHRCIATGLTQYYKIKISELWERV